MSTTDMEAIKKDLVEINAFVQERLDPVDRQTGLLKEETERLGQEISEVQRRDRALRRDALRGRGEESNILVVPEGHYAGMDVLDLALLRRFAYSQRREPFGPAWLERTEEAKRHLVAGITPASIQSSHVAASRKLESWYAVDSRPTRQYESFSRAVLQSMTRAAMDSTTAGSGDELVATLEARELWMDVNLQTLVAPLIPMFPMPSNPFEIPRQLGDANFFPGTENVSGTSTALGTGKTTLTAYELVGQVPYSFSLDEDAVIALLPEIRAGIARNVAEVLDDIILNADVTPTNNINADGATISAGDAGKAHWLIGYDGLIHLALVDNASQSNSHGAAVSDDMFNEIRAASRGRWTLTGPGAGTWTTGACCQLTTLAGGISGEVPISPPTSTSSSSRRYLCRNGGARETSTLFPLMASPSPAHRELRRTMRPQPASPFDGTQGELFMFAHHELPRAVAESTHPRSTYNRQ